MRLLVAEDEALVRDLLVRGLSESGYVVDAAGTGADALHLLRIYRYAAAIIDWRMPEMTGVDVIRAARRVQTPCDEGIHKTIEFLRRKS